MDSSLGQSEHTINSAFTLIETETDTDTDKWPQNSIRISVNVCLCAIWTSTQFYSAQFCSVSAQVSVSRNLNTSLDVTYPRHVMQYEGAEDEDGGDDLHHPEDEHHPGGAHALPAPHLYEQRRQQLQNRPNQNRN